MSYFENQHFAPHHSHHCFYIIKPNFNMDLKANNTNDILAVLWDSFGLLEPFWSRYPRIVITFSFSQSLICLTLAWRIPGTGEPGGLPSMVLQSRTRLKRLSSSSNPMNSFSSNLELCLFGRPALCSYVTKQL